MTSSNRSSPRSNDHGLQRPFFAITSRQVLPIASSSNTVRSCRKFADDQVTETGRPSLAVALLRRLLRPLSCAWPCGPFLCLLRPSAPPPSQQATPCAIPWLSSPLLIRFDFGAAGSSLWPHPFAASRVSLVPYIISARATSSGSGPSRYVQSLPHRAANVYAPSHHRRFRRLSPWS